MERSCQLKVKSTKVFANGNHLEVTFQFANYLNCISSINMIESREENFA